MNISHAHSNSTGHAGHHGDGVFPGHPPAYVLPKAVGPGVVQPADLPDTAKGANLPHWSGILVGTSIEKTADGIIQHNLYANGDFNYLDGTKGATSALAFMHQLTNGDARPAGVLWRDKFNITHGMALLQYGGVKIGPSGVAALHDAAPTAAHLGANTIGVNLGHPEALAIIDGDFEFATVVLSVAPVPTNGAPGWKP